MATTRDAVRWLHTPAHKHQQNNDDDRALKYRCPACGANPGTRCKTDVTNNGKPARRKRRFKCHPARHAKRVLAGD